MPKPSNDNLSEAMDTLALKFVKEMRSAVSEQISLSIQKEILLQIEKIEKVEKIEKIEKANIKSRKTSSVSQKTSSSQANATSSLSNDTRENDKDIEISSSQSNEHPGTDNGGSKDVRDVDTDESNKKEKKKKKKRKRHADDGEETMNRFSCKQQ